MYKQIERGGAMAANRTYANDRRQSGEYNSANHRSEQRYMYGNVVTKPEDEPGRRKSPAKPYTGDKGIKLGNVYDGKAELEDFVAQLSDEDLICLMRGEGMNSPKVC